MEIAGITAKDLELTYYIKLVDKAVPGFERTGSGPLKEVLLWIKCDQTTLHASEKLFMK